MKNEFLKMAGVTSEEDFYKKYPTEDAFFNDFPQAKEMAMGGMIDKNVMMQNEFAKGGQMIKRADGSYSRRGLWDNIRANRGSGKKPTKEMLKQERKIRAEEKAMGGEMYAEGGSFDNPGFKALPEDVQMQIMANTNAYGGQMYAQGGSFDNPGFQALPPEVQAKIRANTNAYGGEMYAQGGSIEIDPAKRGTFKAQATRMGMGVQEAADAILNAPKGKYSPEMRKKANFARNFAKAYGGNMYAMGGELPYSFAEGGEMLQSIDNGGTHEMNPNGGVPATPDGMNLVEEGETVFDGNFVFSNRLKVTPEVAREFSLGKKAVGKSYAEVSKMYQDEERPNDRFNNRASARQLENLAEAQESYKAVEQQQYDQAGQQMNEAIVQQQMQEQIAQQMDPNNPLTRSALSQAEALMQQQDMNQQQMVQQMMPQGQEQQMMPPQQMGYGGKMKYQVGGPFDSVGMSLLPGALDQYNAIYNTDYNLGDMPDPSMATQVPSYINVQRLPMQPIPTSSGMAPTVLPTGSRLPELPININPNISTPSLNFGTPEFASRNLSIETPSVSGFNPNTAFSLDAPQLSQPETAEDINRRFDRQDAAARRQAMQEAAAKGLSYAPAVAGAAGMIQAMSDRPSYMAPAMTNIDFTPTPMDMTQARADAMSAARMAQRGAAAASRGSVGSLMDAQERIAGATARGLGQTAMQQDLYNRQMQQQAAQQSLAQAQANARLQMYADEFNIASDTAKTDRILEMMMATGQNLGSIGTDILNRQTVEKMPLFFNPDGTFKGTTTT